jgi:hypothetical protein
MNRLKSSLAALLLGVAACNSVLASPQDAKARAVSTGHAFGHALLDHPGGMVRTSFSSANAGDGSRSTLGDGNFASSARAVPQKNIIQVLEELPQSRLFTLLAAVGVLFVIAKRRLAADHG